MRYHGNYCGPNWSDGKHQPSVVGDSDAVDEFDRTCKEHDAAYATNKGLRAADLKFARENLLSGNVKRVLAGVAVGLQGLTRSTDRSVIENQKRIIPQTMSNKQNNRNMRYVPVDYSSTLKKNAGLKPSVPSKATLRGIQKPKSIPAAYVISESLRKTKITAKSGVTVLKHKGLIGPVVGSTTYGAVNYQVNAGRAQVFPWASKLAKSYDKYRFTSLKFMYRPVVPTTRAGVVMMSFDYDTLDAVPASKFEQAQTFPNVEVNSFMPSELIVACDSTWRFVRQGNVLGADLKTYDLGQLIVSSAYDTTTITCGELYVEYVMELDKPSYGFPLTLVNTNAGNASSPFTTNVPSTAAAQPFEYLSTDRLVCKVAGEYKLTRRVTGTVITALGNPTITTSQGGLVTYGAFDFSYIDGGAVGGMRQNSLKCYVGDILNFSSIDTAATIVLTTITINECQYLV